MGGFLAHVDAQERYDRETGGGRVVEISKDCASTTSPGLKSDISVAYEMSIYQGGPLNVGVVNGG